VGVKKSPDIIVLHIDI